MLVILRSAARRVSPAYALITIFVIATFAMGGSQRADTQSLVILRPLAALMCGYGFWSLARNSLHRYALLFWLLGATILLCLVHIVPLPPAIWQMLPGRQIVMQIDRVAGLSDEWRPIAMVPSAAYNALFSLLIPLATLLLACRLDRREREALLPLLIGLGTLSAILGVFQMFGGVDGPFYLYRKTSDGWAVGLFANRNHAAVYLACMLPMLAAYVSQPAVDEQRARFRLWVALTIGLFVLPMIVVSGSRGALLVLLPGLASVPLIYRRPVASEVVRQRNNLWSRRLAVYGAVGIVIVAIAFAALLLVRTSVIDRFLQLWSGDELRFRVWGGIVQDVWRFFPIGSGIGSFAEIYQINEPDALLRPTYLNHAHNDILEVAMTAGGPGALILIAALIGWTCQSYDVWSGRYGRGYTAVFGRMASVVFLMLLLASVADYALRTPSFACFAIIVAVWLGASRDQRDRETGEMMV